MLTQKKTASTPVVLITGAARRIGAAMAQHLHSAGYRVAIHCHRSQAEAVALVRRMNALRQDSAKAFTADLCKPNAPQQLVQDTLTWAGRIDLLVNNASLFSRQETDWGPMFALHVRTPFQLSHAAYPALAITIGSIINITDIHAEKPLKNYAMYCQSKAALNLQTKALALEFAPLVRVNAVAPGAILWPENDNALTEEKQQQIIAKTPLKRHGNPVFIAKAVLALVDNPFITGQILAVDGGRSLL
ncbi:MAG TPA: pteridine reductase [Legionella sp.]|nr:pteridine reductase [Legionella sp.]